MSDIITLGKVTFMGGVICGKCNYHIMESSAATAIEVGGKITILIICPRCGQEFHRPLPTPPKKEKP